MSIKQEIVIRLSVVYLFVLLFAIIIVCKVLYLQVFDYEKWSQKAKKLTTDDKIIAANRGDILDQNENILVSSIPFYEVRMDLKSKSLNDKIFIENIDSVAYFMSKLFNDATLEDYRTKEEYLSDFLTARKRGDGYFLIKKSVNYGQLKQMKRFPIFRLGRYKGGFIVIQHNTRKKPFENLAARTIGRMANKGESHNTIGIEGAYDNYLRGMDGLKMMQKLSGNVWLPLNEGYEIEPVDGYDIITTIDINIQDVAENALTKALRLHNAQHGIVIVMEVKTGEIRAMANLADTLGSYREYYNYAIGEAAVPGSTFKLASVMAALEDGVINLTDSVDTENGETTFYDFVVKDSKEGGYGKISVQQAFELSSNVGISKIIYKNYHEHPEKFIDRLYSFNLNNTLDLDLVGEGQPYINYPGDPVWSNVSLPQISIGYEIRLTPLQILTFFNAVANDGKMVKPLFVKAIRDKSKIIKTFEPEILKASICSESTIKKAKQILEGVVERGTAENIKSPNYKIAGKTGTAKLYDKLKGMHVNKYRASFVGYFPAERPKYSIIVVIHSPETGSYYGNIAAGPVFKEISDKLYATDLEMQIPVNKNNDNKSNDESVPYTKNGYKDDLDYALDYLNIPKQKRTSMSNEWVSSTNKNSYVDLTTLNCTHTLVPQVVGMGARDALSLLENEGLKVSITGRGKVVSQSLLPGIKVKRGQEIVLKMSKI
jgi:cell division protein FtsI (penicillin-binding protein 3)